MPFRFDSDNPLWLPPGSVRAILSLMVLVGVFILILLGHVDVSPGDAKWAVGLVLLFYFGSKVLEKLKP